MNFRIYAEVSYASGRLSPTMVKNLAEAHLKECLELNVTKVVAVRNITGEDGRT